MTTSGDYDGETAQIVAEIKDLLDTRIRPAAVAQDGGRHHIQPLRRRIPAWSG